MSRSRLERYLPGNKRVRMIVLMAVDIGMVCLASFLGLFIRFDMNIGRIPAEYTRAVLICRFMWRRPSLSFSFCGCMPRCGAWRE